MAFLYFENNPRIEQKITTFSKQLSFFPEVHAIRSNDQQSAKYLQLTTRGNPLKVYEVFEGKTVENVINAKSKMLHIHVATFIFTLMECNILSPKTRYNPFKINI